MFSKSEYWVREICLQRKERRCLEWGLFQDHHTSCFFFPFNNSWLIYVHTSIYISIYIIKSLHAWDEILRVISDQASFLTPSFPSLYCIIKKPKENYPFFSFIYIQVNFSFSYPSKGICIYFLQNKSIDLSISMSFYVLASQKISIYNIYTSIFFFREYIYFDIEYWSN